MDKFLSIGIPVYNIKEEYLRACIDSVLRNDANDIEVIIVDDCSEDRSADICKEYAKNDERIRFISFDKNRGVSAARNTIIDTAIGKWLMFVDADDLLCEGFYEAVKKFYTADIIYYNYKLITTEIIPTTEKSYIPPVAMDEDMVKKLCICHLCALPSMTDNMNLSAGVIPKIFRRDFIIENHIRFIEGLERAEDRLFMVNALYCGRRVYYSEQIMYLYRINPDSATNRFKPNIADVTDMDLKCSEKLMNKIFPDDKEVQELYLENRVNDAILDNFKQNIFHPKNKEARFKKKQCFLDLLEREPYKTAVEHNGSYLIREKRILLKYARKRSFFVLTMLHRHNILLRIYSTLSNIYEKLVTRIRRSI